VAHCRRHFRKEPVILAEASALKRFQAIQEALPDAVDVSSGVEAVPGEKIWTKSNA